MISDMNLVELTDHNPKTGSAIPNKILTNVV